MPNVKITKNDGQVIEVSDLSFAQVKELTGLNGHSTNGHLPPTRQEEQTTAFSPGLRTSPNYAGFKKSLTEKAQKFFRLLNTHPNGITSDRLAEAMGFKSGSQIGGMTGGGIAKIAGRFNVDIETLYRHEVQFGPDGRIVTYYPGSNINSVL